MEMCVCCFRHMNRGEVMWKTRRRKKKNINQSSAKCESAVKREIFSVSKWCDKLETHIWYHVKMLTHNLWCAHWHTYTRHWTKTKWFKYSLIVSDVYVCFIDINGVNMEREREKKMQKSKITRLQNNIKSMESLKRMFLFSRFLYASMFDRMAINHIIISQTEIN